MDLQPIEDAIAAWVATATGFTVGSGIYFANQNGAQPPAMPFITILIGASATTKGLPEINRTYGGPSGSEVQQLPIDIWDMTVSIQAFAENTVTYPDPTIPIVLPGTSGITAVELLSRVQSALGLETVHAALNAAGISPYEYGEVRRVDAVVNTYFEGRAVLDMKCYVTSTPRAAEGFGYIHEVQGTGTLRGDSESSPRSVPLDVTGP